MLALWLSQMRNSQFSIPNSQFPMRTTEERFNDLTFHTKSRNRYRWAVPRARRRFTVCRFSENPKGLDNTAQGNRPGNTAPIKVLRPERARYGVLPPSGYGTLQRADLWCVVNPKGLDNTAQGNRPGNTVPIKVLRPERARYGLRRLMGLACPFRASRLLQFHIPRAVALGFIIPTPSELKRKIGNLLTSGATIWKFAVPFLLRKSQIANLKSLQNLLTSVATCWRFGFPKCQILNFQFSIPNAAPRFNASTL
jgi:hypothetical protein